MKELNPPFLEFGFYFANIPEAEAFSNLIKALLEMGAKLTGMGTAHRSKGIRVKPFASIHDEVLERVPVRDVADMTNYLADPNTRLIQVYMEGASDIAQDISEIIGYLSVSPDAARTDRHPLAIWTEGEIFTGAFRQQFAESARNAGKQAYKRFRDLVEVVKPAYAAITCEYALECPLDLRHDPRSLAFRDFFVSGTYLGAANLVIIESLFHGAFFERVGDGLYVSCTEEFNPMGKSLEAEFAQWQSVEVAKLIAAVFQI